jgi:Protein of unknown function (DUF3224)
MQSRHFDHVESTFTVSDFAPIDWSPGVTTGVPIGEINMVKTFTGDIDGRSETRFIGGISADQSTGGYAAMESFEGSINGLHGSINFVHIQIISGGTVTSMHVDIVAGSGTSELEGISGTGAIRVDPDGTHRFSLEFTFG